MMSTLDGVAPGADGTAPAFATVVGIGASAGGLKALQQFFASVPADSGLAFVVIMHLDPQRKSRMAALLQDRAAIPVTQVTDTTRVEPNHVYIIPPGLDLTLDGALIQVTDRGERGRHAPVDLFFRTLAESRGADAVAVVLSGTGSDGTAGLAMVHAAGGITAAQSPEEADYNGMPSSAIGSGQVDLVLPAARIAPALIGMRASGLRPVAEPRGLDVEATLARIFALVQRRTGHDFSLYKRATVLRRLERRLRFNAAATLDDYLPILRDDDSEAPALARDLLISVSGFFRDPDAFTALADAIPALFEGKGPEDAVRAWVVGCATGEEAYSVAMLLNEHAATLEHPPQIQIFATDIDEKGYAGGRDALYAAAALADVTPVRQRRFFTQEAGGYRVIKPLREEVLFALHNVLQDPPFSRLDLISCRNLLIYLQPRAQERVLDTFHYALRANGLLFLGSSESAGESGAFAPVAREQRLYRRDVAPSRSPPRPSAVDPPSRAATLPAASTGGFSYGAAHLRMLEAYGPPSLIVDDRLEVVHLSGDAGRYLRLPEGEPSANLIDLSRDELRTELRAALYQAFEKGLPTTRQVRVGQDGSAPVTVRVRPAAAGEAGRFALVQFEEQPVEPRSESETASDGASPLEAELRRTKEQLEAISGARDDIVAKLQQANQELLSINEEQKAAAEELETSCEEIQSINEELIAINQEHQGTIEEQKRTNTDLQNLIEATEIGTIFLDRSMRVRRYTPAVARLFNFVPTDQGRPLDHITHRLHYDGLVTDALGVLESRQRVEREVASDTGEWFAVRIHPYRSPEDGIDGAVITCFDISGQKRVEEELREAKRTADSANLAKGKFLATLSHEFRSPLNGILGYTDLLKMGDPLTPAQAHRISRIQAGAWHLASMIDEVLAFAKMDVGMESISPTQLDGREVARQAMLLVEPMAMAKQLAFVLDSPDEPVLLVTDGVKLRQILVNLCGNAIKYTDRGEVAVRLWAEPGRTVFEVRDTGIGISADDLPRIFERFWQAASGTIRNLGGIGIGLAAAQEFSRLLGGDVDVQSELGVGTVFRLWIPTAEAPSAEPAEPAARGSSS